MIVHLDPTGTAEQLDRLTAFLQGHFSIVRPVRTGDRTYLVCTGKDAPDMRSIAGFPGVLDVHYVDDENQMVSRQWRRAPTRVDLGDGVAIGDGDLAIMAGPCSIEGDEQVAAVVQFLVQQGVRIMRGGVYKPRSSPYAFRGMGMDGLRIMHAHCKVAGLKIVTEVMESEQIEAMYPYVDVFQVGARNAQNFTLLDALGRTDKPVLLKRGISGTLDELLASAEYIFSNGNPNIILCERGVRTYEKSYRNMLDLNAVPVLRERSHLPVVVDPSHGIGVRRYVATMALAGTLAGADGVIVEVHPEPEKAFSDGAQTLSFPEATTLFHRLRATQALRDSFVPELEVLG